MQYFEFVFQACGYTGDFKTVGVLQIEHLGQNGVYDGLCMSILVVASSKKLSGEGSGQWVAIEEQSTVEKLRTAAKNEFGCAKLFDC